MPRRTGSASQSSGQAGTTRSDVGSSTPPLATVELEDGLLRPDAISSVAVRELFRGNSARRAPPPGVGTASALREHISSVVARKCRVAIRLRADLEVRRQARDQWLLRGISPTKGDKEGENIWQSQSKGSRKGKTTY